MGQTKQVHTSTILTSSLTTFELRTFYDGSDAICDGIPQLTTFLPNILQSRITINVGYLNGTPFQEGELLVTSNLFPAAVNFWLDNSGNLIIDAFDSGRYSIDENGDLIYDYCEDVCSTTYYECGFIEEDFIE